MICSPYPSFSDIQGQTVLMPMTIILAVIALAGNALVLTAVLKYEALRSQPPYKFIASLSSADILVSLLAQPLYVTVLRLGSSYGCWVQRLSHFVGTLTSSASALGILIVTIDRFYFITRPLQYHTIMTPLRVKSALACIWVNALLLSFLPYIVGLKAFHIIAFLATINSTIVCSYCYYVIYKVVRCKVGDEITTGQDRSRTQHQATRTVAFVMLAMTVCWPPYIACSFVWALDINAWKEDSPIVSIYFWLLALGHWNSTINVLIYSWKNTELRTAIKRILKPTSNTNELIENSLKQDRSRSTNADIVA